MKYVWRALLAIAFFVSGSVRPANAEVLVRISEEEIAYHVVEIGGQVWVAMESGAYRVEGSSLKEVFKGAQVNMISEVGEEIWLSTANGVFRIVGDQAYPHLEEQIGTPWVMAIRGSPSDFVWLGTEDGLYRVRGAAVDIPIGESVYSLVSIDGRIWVGTDRNAYRIEDSGTPEPLFNVDKWVPDIVDTGKSVWLITYGKFYQYGPCYRVEDDLSPRLTRGLENSHVTHVAGVDRKEEAWFGTTNGIFRLEGDEAQRADSPRIEEPVNTIADVRDEVWLGTTERAYRRIDGAFEGFPEGAQKLGIKGIMQAAGKIWLWGQTGVYRLDEEVEIKIDPTTHSVFGLFVHLGNRVRIDKASYDLDGEDPYGGEVVGAFEVIVESELGAFELARQTDEFTPVKSLERRFPFGFQIFHIVGSDAYGNRTRPIHNRIFVLPGLGYLALAGAVLLLLVTFSAIWALRRLVFRQQRDDRILGETYAPNTASVSRQDSQAEIWRGQIERIDRAKLTEMMEDLPAGDRAWLRELLASAREAGATSLLMSSSAPSLLDSSGVLGRQFVFVMDDPESRGALAPYTDGGVSVYVASQHAAVRRWLPILLAEAGHSGVVVEVEL